MPLYAPLPLLACIALALSACKPSDKEPVQSAAVSATAAPSATADKTATPPVATTAPAGEDNLNVVSWMQRLEEYRAVAEQTYRVALEVAR